MRSLDAGSVVQPACAVLLLLGVLGLGGCDQAPWSSGPKRPAALPSHSAGTPAGAPSSSEAMPSPPEVAPAELLATVNGVPIAKAELQMRLQDAKTRTENAGQKWVAPSREQLKAILDGVIEDELASQAATARGRYEEDTKLRWVILRRTFLAQEWLRWKQQRELEVSDDEIQKFYDDFKLGFREPEKRQLRQITVASEDQAKQALARLYSESMDFGDLARQISLAPSAKDGGKIAEWVMRDADLTRWFGREAAREAAKTQGIISLLDPAQEAAAFAIDHENGLSNYVKGGDGRYHIFQLVKLQRERQIPLEERKEWIRTTLLTQKLQQAIKDLRSKAAIQEFPERLDGIAP